jgi:hypothetical protein
VCFARSCRDSQPGVSGGVILTVALPRLVHPNRAAVKIDITDPQRADLTEPQSRPGRHRQHVPISRSVKNRSSGLDCFTLDCFGAVPIAGFAASQPRFTAYANTP